MGKKKLSFKDIMVNYGVIIIMILLVIYTGFTSKNFLSGNNLNNILMNMSSRIVIALGIAGCIITAGCRPFRRTYDRFWRLYCRYTASENGLFRKVLPGYGAAEYFCWHC